MKLRTYKPTITRSVNTYQLTYGTLGNGYCMANFYDPVWIRISRYVNPEAYHAYVIVSQISTYLK